MPEMYPVDLPVTVEKQVDGVTFHVKGARLEHFGDAVPPFEPEKLLLTLKVRLDNVGAQYGHALSGDDFRLVVNDVPLAPLKVPLGLLPYQAVWTATWCS